MRSFFGGWDMLSHVMMTVYVTALGAADQACGDEGTGSRHAARLTLVDLAGLISLRVYLHTHTCAHTHTHTHMYASMYRAGLRVRSSLVFFLFLPICGCMARYTHSHTHSHTHEIHTFPHT